MLGHLAPQVLLFEGFLSAAIWGRKERDPIRPRAASPRFQPNERRMRGIATGAGFLRRLHVGLLPVVAELKVDRLLDHCRAAPLGRPRRQSYNPLSTPAPRADHRVNTFNNLMGILVVAAWQNHE